MLAETGQRSVRHYNEKSVKAFKNWVVLHDWRKVYNTSGSNEMTEGYQDMIKWALDKFFLLKTMRKKSSDLPWMNNKLRKMIENRK